MWWVAGVAGSVEAHDVGAAQRLGQAHVSDVQPRLRVALAARAHVEKLTGQRPHQLRVTAPDAAKAHHGEGGAAQLQPKVSARVPATPRPGAQIGLDLPEAPRCGQAQRQGQLRGRVRQDIGRVGDGHPALAACVQIHVVVADREVGDHLQARPGSAEQLGIHPHRRVGDDRGRSGRQLSQALRGRVKSAGRAPRTALRAAPVPPAAGVALRERRAWGRSLRAEAGRLLGAARRVAGAVGVGAGAGQRARRRRSGTPRGSGGPSNQHSRISRVPAA